MRLLTAAFVGGFFLSAAYAQHVHRDGSMVSDEVGKFYNTWRQPTLRSLQGNRVRSCCNLNDCAPSEIVAKGNKLYVRNHKMRPGEDVEIPPNVIEQNQSDPRESPDGLNHACVNSSGVLCATLGAGG